MSAQAVASPSSSKMGSYFSALAGPPPSDLSRVASTAPPPDRSPPRTSTISETRTSAASNSPPGRQAPICNSPRTPYTSNTSTAAGRRAFRITKAKAKRRGHIGLIQGVYGQPTCTEEPGKSPVWRRWFRGLNPEGDDVWFTYRPARAGSGRGLEYHPCREVLEEDEELDEADAEHSQNIFDHPCLVRLLDHNGFEANDTRKETCWEHCDAGTLNRLILAQEGEELPESLIWHTLLSLLEAVLYLHTGDPVMVKSGDEPFISPRPGWKPIAHNLINPANIFYCHPRKEPGRKEATYGACKLGNFSKCLTFRSEYEKVGWVRLQEDGVDGEPTGYEAPERNPDWPGCGMTADGLSDVWSIGAVAVAMMSGRSVWKYVMREHINAAMPSRADADWSTVPPVQRFARLQAMTTDQPGSCKLRWALPQEYSLGLRWVVERMLMLVELPDATTSPHTLRGRPLPGVLCMVVADLYNDVLERVRGTEEEEEYVLEGTPESP